MDTVFSYIVPKLSTQTEKVATEALAFILRNERAMSGLMKLLHGIAPGLPPSLRFGTQHSFDTQETEASARPDMCGSDGGTPRVFIENKFSASLTPNQPVEYLKELAGFPNPAVLLMIVPEKRVEPVWRQCDRLLHAAGASPSAHDHPASVDRAVTVDLVPAAAIKPILAITSWTKLLLAIEDQLADEPDTRNDLRQLRALCVAADAEYAPFSITELMSPSIPALVLQLNKIIEAAVQDGAKDGFLKPGATAPTWEQNGRYVRFQNCGTVDPWLGTDFRLWRKAELTPLWLIFTTDRGRALEVRPILRPWTEQHDVAFVERADGAFAVGIEVVAGEDKEHVTRSIVNQLKEIAAQLSALPAIPGATP